MMCLFAFYTYIRSLILRRPIDEPDRPVLGEQSSSLGWLNEGHGSWPWTRCAFSGLLHSVHQSPSDVMRAKCRCSFIDNYCDFPCCCAISHRTDHRACGMCDAGSCVLNRWPSETQIYPQHHIEASLPEFFLTFSFFGIHHAVGSVLYQTSRSRSIAYNPTIGHCGWLLPVIYHRSSALLGL
jgi:hypothetical protein